MNRMTAMLLCCAVAACSKPSSDASNVASALRSTTSSTGVSSTDPVCRLYSSSDASRYLGKAAKDGEVSMGGCQWDAEQGTGVMNVQVMSARYHEKPSESPGYRALPDMAGDAFVATFMDGWTAGAIDGKDAIRASLTGDKATEASTIALLKETIKRHAAHS